MARIDPIVDLNKKWGIVVANIIKNDPKALDGIFPMYHEEKAKKNMLGKSKQEQINLVIGAQLAVIEANANLQALIEAYNKQNPQ